MISGSKSMGIQMEKLNISSRLKTIEEMQKIFNAGESDPVVIRLRAEIYQAKQRLEAAQGLVIDNVTVFP